MRLALVIVIAAGCSSNHPTCDELERYLARITTAHDTSLRTAAGSGPFVPQFGGEFSRTIGERCRSGDLVDEARRCLLAATGASDLDRCADKYGL